MENRRIAGNVIQGNIVVSFVGEEHNFTFVRAYMNPSSCLSITLKAKNGFVEGRTDENKRVLIFWNRRESGMKPVLPNRKRKSVQGFALVRRL